MDNAELIAELLQAVSKDVAALKTKIEKLPTQAPTDYKASLEGLTTTVEALQKMVEGLLNQPKQAPPVVDLEPITTQLDRIEYQSRQNPERKMSQYVQVGAFASGLMVVLLVITTWSAQSWRSERNAFEASDWKWRNLRQLKPVYVRTIDSTYTVMSQASDGKDLEEFYQWVVKQEQADATREAARKAAEQAAALTQQANQLEGKKQQAQ